MSRLRKGIPQTWQERKAREALILQYLSIYEN